MDDEAELQLIAKLRAGDDEVFGAIFERYREKLRRMVQFRLASVLVGRIDPEDVVQDVFLDARQRLYGFREAERPMSLWLRLVAQQTIIDLHRRHIGTHKRTAAKERAFAQSHGISGWVAGNFTSPSQAVMREERKQALTAALEEMEEIDREVLVLRHFEDLSNKEVAELLEIGENAASNRYVRALVRLKGMLGDVAP